MKPGELVEPDLLKEGPDKEKRRSDAQTQVVTC